MHNLYYTCTMPYCLPTRFEYCVNALSTTWWWDEVILPAVAVVTMPLVSLYLLLGVGVYVFVCILWWRGQNLKLQLHSSSLCSHMCATFFIDGDFLLFSITLSVPFRSLIQLGTASKCWQLKSPQRQNKIICKGIQAVLVMFEGLGMRKRKESSRVICLLKLADLFKVSINNQARLTRYNYLQYI